MKKNGRVNREREREKEEERDERTDRQWKLNSLCDKINVEQSRFKFVLPVKLNKVMKIKTNIIDFFLRFYTASQRNEK